MWKFSAWSFFLVVTVLAVKALAQDDDGGFDLTDALDESDKPSVTQKSKLPPSTGGGETGDDLKLSDFLDDDDDAPPTKAPPRVVPKAPLKPKPKPAGELDLSDALDPNNDIGGKDKNKGQADKGAGGGGRGDGSPNNRGTGGGTFTDDDLYNLAKDETYKPDKGKEGARGGSGPLEPADENDYDTMAETGTIAGIVSAVAMALVGAVTSYISYQKKKFCFSIQQSLNADLVKTENPDAVVATEPQVQQTLLEPPNAEPPSEENAV